MFELSQYALVVAAILIALALVGYAAVVASAGRRRRTPALVRAGAARTEGGHTDGDDAAPAAAPSGAPARGAGWYASRMVWLAVVLLTAALVLRTLATGHAPFANQYEFAISFAWGITLAFAWFDWRYDLRAIALAVLPVVLALMLYATTQDAEPSPLIPALQNSVLLTLHVLTAALSYGAACVSFGAAVLYLLKPHVGWKLPSYDKLDEIGYRGTVVTFPLLTVMIILGALWADTAWGRYWGWDPKETAALVTWLIYAAYLHARVVRDWRGKRAAWLLVLGFAAVMFSYFGNHFFGGLHSYG
ncbi:MAG: c-type cytochrome biogenesis protein CcsB [Actinomycetes bacterium]|nr:c-type cytochrome biogenesis protein CcsB [Actinomycetes bacterium]MDX5380953.1 c-type cytochrome biogenesis protein CcsB [Actinomycetes bacterium]MDX5400066.1 c-type cytochrome biogenesis protein CcsB [Actinomycetes bacterium]